MVNSTIKNKRYWLEVFGTTALACIRLGVDYLGTKIDAEYIKVVNEDIEKRKKNKVAMDEWLEDEINEKLSG